MDKKFKKKWVAALRSNKYQQTTGTLKDAYGFCCLGVACDLQKNKLWEKNTFNKSSTFIQLDSLGRRNAKMDSADVELPANLLKKLKMTDDQQQKLISMNDGGKSFAEIADWIKENL